MSLALPSAASLPSTLSATAHTLYPRAITALFEASPVLWTRPTPRLFPDSFAFIRLPVAVRDRHGDRGPAEVSFGSDAIPLHLMGSSTTAERQRLA
jgi:hypothetical protein